MQKLIPSILILCLLVLFSAARKNTVDNQQKDLAVFKRVVLEKESRLDLHIQQDSVLYYFNQLDKVFLKKQSKIDQFRFFGIALSKIQCGHTQIQPNSGLFREWLTVRKSLPIDYYLIGKRLVVNKLSKDDKLALKEGRTKYEQGKKIPAGSEIITINQKTVTEMMNEIGRFLSSDENSIDFKYYQSAQLFEFYRHISDPFDKDSIQVEYVTFDGDTNSLFLQIGTAPVHTMNKRMSKNEETYQKNETNMGEFAIANHSGYFRFRSFSRSHGIKYDEFLRRSFKKLKAKNMDRLIVDLRGNTGGAMQYSFMRYIVGEDVLLGRYIIGKPKKGIESSHLKKISNEYSKHKKISKMQKRLIRHGKFNNGEVKTKKVDTSLIFHGDIIVITDEGTFSSAAILACHLKTFKNAKIIGRRAGGSFYLGNAGALTLKLPKSKLKLFVNPNTFYSHLKPVDNPLEIKEPEIILSPLILDQRKLDMYYLKTATKSFD